MANVYLYYATAVGDDDIYALLPITEAEVTELLKLLGTAELFNSRPGFYGIKFSRASVLYFRHELPVILQMPSDYSPDDAYDQWVICTSEENAAVREDFDVGEAAAVVVTANGAFFETHLVDELVESPHIDPETLFAALKATYAGLASGVGGTRVIDI